MSDAAEARRLIEKLQKLEEEGEIALEAAYTKSTKNVPNFEDLLTDVDDLISEARRIASLNADETSSPESIALKKSQASALAQLEQIKAKLLAFQPPPPLPFQLAEADIRIGASGDLAQALIAPIVSTWSGASGSQDDNLTFFFDSATKGKIVNRNSRCRGGIRSAGKQSAHHFLRRPFSYCC